MSVTLWPRDGFNAAGSTQELPTAETTVALYGNHYENHHEARNCSFYVWKTSQLHRELQDSHHLSQALAAVRLLGFFWQAFLNYEGHSHF